MLQFLLNLISSSYIFKWDELAIFACDCQVRSVMSQTVEYIQGNYSLLFFQIARMSKLFLLALFLGLCCTIVLAKGTRECKSTFIKSAIFLRTCKSFVIDLRVIVTWAQKKSYNKDKGSLSREGFGCGGGKSQMESAKIKHWKWHPVYQECELEIQN